MKHTLLYVLTAATLFGLASCNRQEENLFDQSAADRLHAMQQAVSDKLVGASNGWELNYFPYPDNAGYAILAQFKNDGTVKLAAKNPVSSKNLYKEETSMWDIDGTQGCVLTFHTFNTLLSIFADPLGDGVGYNGDYEFVVLPSGADTVRLKGKKHGAYISMIRLNSSQDWKQYFAAIDEFNDETFTDNDGMVMSYWDGEKEIPVTYHSGMFTYSVDGEEMDRGFIVNPQGMHFYSGLPLAGNSNMAQDFVLSDDKKVLKTQDGKAFISGTYTASDFFMYRFTNYSRWLYMADGSDATTQARVNTLCQQALSKGAEISNIAYERTTVVSGTGRKSYAYGLHITYLVEGKQFGGSITLNQTVTSDAITFQYKSHDEALNPLFTRIDPMGGAVDQIMQIFGGTFTPESYTGSALNMTQLKLNKADGTSIHIKAEQIIM